MEPSNNVSRSGMFREAQQVPMQNENTNFRKMIDKSTSTPTVDEHINNDNEIVKQISHTLLKNETLGGWYSRVGLGRAQILQMSKGEIREFVALVSQNENPPAPTVVDDPSPDVRHTSFVITD